MRGVVLAVMIVAPIRAVADPEAVPPPPACDADDDAASCTKLAAEELRNIPIRGTSYAAALGIAPGAVGDDFGTGFGGATSLETTYVIDDTNTTDLALGGLGTSFPIEFLESIAVLRGPGASHRVSTGGLVHLTTRRGGDELRGSAVLRFTPGALVADRVQPQRDETISTTSRLAYDTDAVVELGGRLVRERLWFYAGLGLQLVRTEMERVVAMHVDTDQNDVPDLDTSGRPIRLEIDRRRAEVPASAVPFIARVNVAAAPDHQGSIAVFGTTSRVRSATLFDEAATTNTTSRRTDLDVVSSWSSRFGATRLDAVVAWHGHRAGVRPRLAAGELVPQWNLFLSPTEAAARGHESPAVAEACDDFRADDPFPLIENCPGLHGYVVGGAGWLGRSSRDRFAARVTASRHVRAVGAHDVSFGLDLQSDRVSVTDRYSGGERGFGASTLPDQLHLSLERFVEVGEGPGFEPCGTDINGEVVSCRQVASSTAQQTARSFAGFVRDTWTLSPDLAIDAGLRYGRQSVEGHPLGAQWAPSAGVTYDWVGDGRGLVYVHAGRYFQELVASRLAFATRSAAYESGSCDVDLLADPSTTTCPLSVPFPQEPAMGPLRGKAAYDDELVAGVDREISSRVSLGAEYQQRSAGRVLEDVEDADGQYRLANPDGARRDYRAVHLMAQLRGSERYRLWATYTRSWLRGNYSGYLDPGSGQVDPNQLATFDFHDLTPPVDAALPLDRAHRLAVDGYYTWRLGHRHAITAGGRLRLQSGAPLGTLGSHYLYGSSSVDIISRGQLGRTEGAASLDVHLGFRHHLEPRNHVELFVDLFDAFNGQSVAAVYERYTLGDVRPIRGGDPTDLPFLKEVDSNGTETSVPARRNPLYGTPTTWYAPRSVRFGVRWTF